MRDRYTTSRQCSVEVYLIDGTYELFRHYYGLRRILNGQARPCGAVVGVLGSVLQLIEGGATQWKS